MDFECRIEISSDNVIDNLDSIKLGNLKDNIFVKSAHLKVNLNLKMQRSRLFWQLLKLPEAIWKVSTNVHIWLEFKFIQTNKQTIFGTCQAQTARLPKVGTGASACEKNEIFAELKKQPTSQYYLVQLFTKLFLFLSLSVFVFKLSSHQSFTKDCLLPISF